METEKQHYNRLKILLATERVKNKDLAKHLEVTEQTVSKWATNTNQPSIPELYRIAEFLKVDVSELLEPSNNISQDQAKAELVKQLQAERERNRQLEKEQGKSR